MKTTRQQRGGAPKGAVFGTNFRPTQIIVLWLKVNLPFLLMSADESEV